MLELVDLAFFLILCTLSLMKDKKISLATQHAYKSFAQQRDLALDRIYQNSLLELTDVSNACFNEMISYIIGALSFRKTGPFNSHDVRMLRATDDALNHIISKYSYQIEQVALKLRRRVYILTLASEGEAIGRAYGDPSHIRFTPEKKHELYVKPTWSGGTFAQRAMLSLSQVKNKMMHEYQRGLMNETFDIEEVKNKLLRCIPRSRRVDARKPIAKTKLKEAYQEKPFDYSFDNITEDEWDDIINAYKKEYIPVNRSPKAVYGTETVDGEEQQIYAWEIEQEITQDFVLQVRDGQVDAANQNGITDFVWIAIVDSRTDDCCMWRDGLLTSEIEAELTSGDHQDDACDSIVPPAHFNCRCRLAPAADDLPERPQSNIGEFDEWLNSE